MADPTIGMFIGDAEIERRRRSRQSEATTKTDNEELLPPKLEQIKRTLGTMKRVADNDDIHAAAYVRDVTYLLKLTRLSNSEAKEKAEKLVKAWLAVPSNKLFARFAEDSYVAVDLVDRIAALLKREE